MTDYKFAYENQKRAAKLRGIEWTFTFDTWLKWWKDTGKLDFRGRSRGSYMMCRYNDAGPYSADNVYCGKHSNNIKDSLNRHGVRRGFKLSFITRSRVSDSLRRKYAELRHANCPLTANTLTADAVSKRISVIRSIGTNHTGWVNDVASALEISHTQVRRFINKYGALE